MPAGKVWELSHSSAKITSNSKPCASNARIPFACTGLTLYSSGHAPGYRGMPLNSNVGQNTMLEMRVARSACLQRLLGPRHLSPLERAVRPSAAKRAVRGPHWGAAGKYEVFNNRSLYLERLLHARQPSPLAWAVRPAAAKRTARGRRLKASHPGFHAPAPAVTRHRLQGQRWLPAEAAAATDSRSPPPRQPNPSFERTFPGVPVPAAQLKRWAKHNA